MDLQFCEQEVFVINSYFFLSQGIYFSFGIENSSLIMGKLFFEVTHGRSCASYVGMTAFYSKLLKILNLMVII